MVVWWELLVKVSWQYLACKFPWNIDLDVILIWNEWHSLFNKYLQMHKNRKRHLLIIPPSLLHSSLEGSNEVNDITSTFGSSHRMHTVPTSNLFTICSTCNLQLDQGDVIDILLYFLTRRRYNRNQIEKVRTILRVAYNWRMFPVRFCSKQP